MANSDDQKSRDEIRVVGDEEEVIRLDSPKKMGKKSGKAKMETLESAMSGETKEKEGDSAGAEEKRVNWGEEFEDREESTSVPMGWFYLLGIGLVGVIVWIGFQIAFEDPGNGEDGGNGVLAGGAAVEPGDESQALLEAEKHYEEMEKAVADFLAAATVEERAKFVRHPERVLPLMQSFYENRPLRTFRYEKVRSYMTVALSSKPFIALAVITEEEEALPILIEDSPDGLLIDWESFVCYQPVPPEEYAENKPTEPVSFRVYATFDNHYAYEFSEEEKYLCFKLHFRNSKTLLYGYVKRGSEVEQKFRDVYALSEGRVSKPLILKVRFLEDSKAKRGVLIEDLESPLWAFAENPAGEAE